MRVALSNCDKKFCQKLERMLRKYEELRRIHVELELFADEHGLDQRLKEGRQFDLILADDVWGRVESPPYDPKDEAGGYLPRIVYLHFQEERVLECLECSSSCIRERVVNRKRIFSLLDELSLVHEQNLFSYFRERIKYQIPYSEILFFQSDRRKIEIFTIDSEQPKEYIGKLSEIQKQGLPPDFITIHKSYIVNIRYISKRSYAMLCMQRRWLSISQNYRCSVRAVLEQYPIERISAERAEDESLQQNIPYL